MTLSLSFSNMNTGGARVLLKQAPYQILYSPSQRETVRVRAPAPGWAVAAWETVLARARVAARRRRQAWRSSTRSRTTVKTVDSTMILESLIVVENSHNIMHRPKL